MGFFTNKGRIGPNIKPNVTSGIFGHVDYCNREGMAGWVLDLARPMSPLTVCAYLYGKEIYSATTDQSRIDITNLTGLTAHCGFMLRWDRSNLAEAIKALPAGSACALEVRLADDARRIASNVKALKVEDVRRWIEEMTPENDRGVPSALGGRVSTSSPPGGRPL